MIKLHGRSIRMGSGDPFVARVRRGQNVTKPDHPSDVFYIDDSDLIPTGFHSYLCRRDTKLTGIANCWPLPDDLSYLEDGDILEIVPASGQIWVMYRRNSPHNSILLTERCNSNCIMCSQPPKKHDDSYLVNAFLAAIPLMSYQTQLLGITGGEPTLLGDLLFDVIRSCKTNLPSTGLHMLSNGRLFNYLSLCRDLADIAHPDFVVGIPLYSDIAHLHDFVVQASGAFDQTVRGIMNLARYDIRTEIRIVLHQETVRRLPDFAKFIVRNMPFVEHVALMGLEMMGYVKMNLDALWIDPYDYQSVLREAVDILQHNSMDVSIYNHQLCTLDRGLWPVAQKSISDWKNEYIPECDQCSVKDSCGGFFFSSTIRRSRHISPIHV